VRKGILLAGALIAAAAVAGAASAADLVTNGGFESNGGNGQLGYNTSATGWSVSSTPSDPQTSYVFLWSTSNSSLSGTTADTTGALGWQGTVALWGPDNGGSWVGSMLSPNGGAFIGEDPVYDNSSPAITQTITGLTASDNYFVTFDWAAAQQTGFTGATYDTWTVDLGDAATQTTSQINLANKAFSGWTPVTMEFTADESSEVLSFVANGGPSSSLPPFALLDGVSVVPVPEPATWAMMLLGVGALGASLRMRRREIVALA